MVINTLAASKIQFYPEGNPNLPANSTKIKISIQLLNGFEANQKVIISHQILGFGLSPTHRHPQEFSTETQYQKHEHTIPKQRGELSGSLNLLISKPEDEYAFDQFFFSHVENKYLPP